jgi:hypothetical protein
MDLTQEMIDKYYDAGHEDRYETICALIGESYQDFLEAGYNDMSPVRQNVLDVEVKMWLAMPSDK